jgi:glutathione synthase/RimK-type ligase-like ATP-grasp enzyme
MPHDDRHAEGDTVHLLYENPDWLPPVIAGLEAEGFRAIPYAVGDGALDPAAPPPDGLWWNRMSPSAHTRGHGNAVATMRETLAWLDAWGRRVINGTRSFGFEVSKLQQDLVLRRHGIHTPRTVLAVGREAVARAGRTFATPFLVKHNQGGKGLGIALFNNADELDAHLDAGGFDPDPNGQVVVQQYVRPAEPFITRVELVGGKFLFAMRSSTVGGFELCPSDFCQAEKKQPDVCPADGGATFSPSPLTADDPLVKRFEALCQAEGLDLAGIEFLEDADGQRYTYDINANTNYNAALGRALGVDGMREVARWIRRALAPRAARA